MFAVLPVTRLLVSNSAGRDRTSESLASVSSSGVIAVSLMRRSSLKISETAGAVTSVRTPDATTNGPAPCRNTNCELAPYV